MIRVKFCEECWRYVITLNGVTYTKCDRLEEVRLEIGALRRELKYGR